MFVSRTGMGPSVFLALHGWGGDHRTFDPILPYLPDGAAVVAPDLPGYGRTASPFCWSLETVLGPVEALLREIGSAAPVTVVGSCSGAILGILLAERAAGLVRRLVLFDPFAYVPWYFRIFLAGPFGRIAYLSTFANPLGRWIANQSLRGHRTAASNLTGSFAGVDPEVPLRHLRILKEVGDIQRFRAIIVPTDLVFGERTFGAVRKSVRIWLSVLPHARASEIRGAGHLPLKERPVEAARVVFADEARGAA